MNLVRTFQSANGGPIAAALVFIVSTVACAASCAEAQVAEPPPFQYRVEVYRDESGDTMAFALRLEQPFLAEEFEQSGDLSLSPLDRNAMLVYPKQARFEQKHAEFHGRLRGAGRARLRLAYEVLSESPDGGRQVEPKTMEIEVAIPEKPAGPDSILTEWARQQNAYFLNLLESAPDATFFDYVLLQSRERYGVKAPALKRATREQIEKDLYFTFSGGLAVQQALQRDILETGTTAGDPDVHISQLSPPELRSLDYPALLERQREKGIEPRPHDVARLVPADQYFLHAGSMRALDELMTISHDWGDSLLRLITVRAREQQLRAKLAEQLCLPGDPESGSGVALFADEVVAEVAVTGADMFVAEGADVTLLLRIVQRGVFDAAIGRFLDEVRARHPDLVEREFNYRGQRIQARYTDDRAVSSFAFTSGEYAIYSNSHRAIRRIVDTLAGGEKSLHDAVDYRYVTTVLPPRAGPDEDDGAYLFASEAFLRALVSPSLKISEKRRLECFNNLVMLNNASLFYRLEHGASPSSLVDLIQGRFVNPARLVCPHGGAYAIDAAHDSCTCSLHNRLKYLTPNVELDVLQVSDDEKAAYDRYKQRYAATWGKYFDPLAVRVELADRVKLEVAVLPFANGTEYRELRDALRKQPAELALRGIAKSAVLSFAAVPGAERLRELIAAAPGFEGILDADPTLTDLAFIGDRASVHFCDGATILEVDPARFEPLNLLVKASVGDQAGAALGLAALTLPAYVAIEVRDGEKAVRLLRALSSNAFLETSRTLGLPSSCDAYRLPDYKGHEIYVASYQLYALKLRLSIALVENQLVAATRPETLREVIDASQDRLERGGPDVSGSRLGHALLRLNRRAVAKLEGDLRVYWAEKAREACHRNVMSIYNLATLYEIPVAEVGKLSDAKYGVVDFCPDGGEYSLDAARDQVRCSVHGNRVDSRLDVDAHGSSSFSRFLDAIDEIVASLRFEGDDLIATVEIARSGRP